MKYLSICLTLALATMLQGYAGMRTWTSVQGTTINAEMIAADDQTVKLKFENGTVRDVRLASLIAEDREYVAKKAVHSQAQKIERDVLASFNQPWPKITRDPANYEVEVIQDGPDEFIYETPHFRFISDGKLGKALMKTISTIFEATYEANKALPLGNMPWIVKGEKFQARFFRDIAQYHSEGGPLGSAGVFIRGRQYGRTGIVLVPFRSLGIKPYGSSYTVDRNRSFNTLIHEITHQMMTGAVKKAGWFIEGSAEYVAQTPYRGNKFIFSASRNSIAETVTGYGKNNKGGRALGKDIKARFSFEDFMNMPYGKFTSYGGHSYGLASLTAYYFYHVDGKGDAARIKAYIQALMQGKPEKEAQALLLDGRTYNQLGQEVSAFWKRCGITITFPENRR